MTVLLIVGFLVSFAAIGSADTTWARLCPWFPLTAPLAMPNRIAMGAATWWDPIVAVALTLAAIAGLVQFGGRVYTGAILHTGPTLKLRAAWRGTPRVPQRRGDTDATAGPPPATTRPSAIDRRTTGALIGIGAGLGAAVGLLTRDVIIGIGAGAACYAVASAIVKARVGHDGRHHNHR